MRRAGVQEDNPSASARRERPDGVAARAGFISYILKTGNTWKNGIEDFTLNVPANPTDANRASLSLCIRQIHAGDLPENGGQHVELLRRRVLQQLLADHVRGRDGVS